MKTRIENVTVVTMDADFNYYENGSVTIENDSIIAINDYSINVDKIIDGKKCLVIEINDQVEVNGVPIRTINKDEN